MKRTWIIGCVAFGVTLLSACGGSGGTPTAASSPSGSSSSSASSSSSTGGSTPSTPTDGCDLLTDDEVQAVIGVPVTRREPSARTASGFGCVKGTDRAADVTTGAFVSFSVFTTGGSALLDQLATQPDTEQVSGLGDRAYFQSSAGFVFFAKGDTVISVQVFKFGQIGTRDEILSLARKALSRV